MNPQSPGGFRDVVTAICQNAMYVLPFGLCQGWDQNLVIAFNHRNLCPASLESVQDVIRIRGLGQKIDGTQAYGINGCRDTSETGKDQDLNFRTNSLEVRDNG